MRKSSWLIILLFAATGAPKARADSYAATFTCSAASVCNAQITPTAPDVTFPSPEINETWTDSETVFVSTLILSPLDSPTDAYSWINTTFPDPGSIALLDFTMQITDLTTDTSEMMSGATIANPDDSGQGVSDFGNLTFTHITPTGKSPATTPEPNSFFLMLTGIGLVFVMQKRIRQGLPQAH